MPSIFFERPRREKGGIATTSISVPALTATGRKTVAAAVRSELAARSSVTATVPAPGDTTAPTAPVITASATGSSSISVALTTPSTDVGGSGVATYALEYKRNVDVSWIVASAALTAGQFPFSIGGVAGSTLYDTRARATDVAGNTGAYSATSSATTQTSSGVTTVTSIDVTSAVGGTLLPFTFGQPFKQGDVPAGTYATLDSPSAQVQPRNYWSDGSLKYAVISGRKTLTTSASTIALQRTSTAPSGSNVAEPSAATLGSTISVTLTGAGAGTYTPQIAATNGITAWNRTTARKVREFLGPMMSEFHYYSPTSDGHLTIWWYLRVYSDRTEVETAIEQGWTKVAGATAKSYTANVVINGVSKFNAAVNHRHHARWSRIDWIGTDPQITPKHDRAYLGSTKMASNYAPTSVNSTLMNGWVQSAAPMTRGNFDLDGTGTGAHAWLGILPEWEAGYVISGDIRAYRAMLANEQASNCCSYGVGPGGGNDGFVQRDESTGLPASPTDFKTDSYDTGGSLVTGSGGIVWTTDPAHAWAAGYLSYLTTGRWFSLETCQLQAVQEFLTCPNYGNDNLRIVNGHVQDRAVAWMMRTAAAALAITPDSGHALRAKYVTYLQDSINSWVVSDVGFNTLGIRKNIYNHVDYGSSQSAGIFEMYFLTAAFAFAKDIASHALNGTAQTNFTTTVNFHCSMPVGMLGTRPGGFCYKQAANYGLVVGPSPGTFYASFGAWFDAAVAAGQLSSDNVCSLNGALTGGNFPSATSYWGNLMIAITCAVDQGVSGAQAAYDRMLAASNWNTLYSDFPNAPQFATVPRAAALSAPSWSNIASGTAVRVTLPQTAGAYAQSLGAGSYPGTNPYQIGYAWCGWASGRRNNRPRVYGCGGGHNNGSWDGILEIDVLTESPAWATFLAASAVGAVTTSGTYTDGRMAACHNYNNFVGDNSGNVYMLGRGAYYSPSAGDSNVTIRHSTSGQTTLGTIPQPLGSNPMYGAGAFCPPETPGGGTVGRHYWMSNVTSKLRILEDATGLWSSESNADIFFGNYLAAAIDTTRGKLLVVGSGGAVYYWDLATLSRRAITAGAPPGYQLNLEYDPIQDAFVSVGDQSLTVRLLSASSLAAGSQPSWTTRTYTGVTPSATSPQGAFKKAFFFSELGGIVYIPGDDTNMWLLKS